MVRIVAVLLVLAVAVGVCFAIGGLPTLNWLWQLPLCIVGSALGLGLLYFLTLWFACALVDLEKPQKKDSKFYRVFAQTSAQLAMWIVGMRVHTKGLEKTPKEGRFLLVCNHINDLDPVTLLAYFGKRQLAFISKRENSTMFIVGKVMHKLMCQMINRENDKEALKTIINCIHLIQEDEVSIAVFPEGYIHDDHLFYPFRPGVFKIAQRTKVPIVVCTLRNTPTVFHNMAHLKPCDVDLHLLTVIQPEEYEGISTVELANRIHDIMAEDIGYDGVFHGTENT